MRFGWTNPRDARDKRDKTNALFRQLKPMLTLTASGYMLGSPPAGYETAYRKVNSLPWNGYPRGYWLYMGATDRTEDNGTSYTVRLEFLNNIEEDWSQYEVYRDPKTGLKLPVTQTSIDELRAIPYDYGFTARNGIIKAGLYNVADFNAVFSFGST
jgi:hypothetical protein